MLESLAVLAVTLVAAVLVFARARERLRTPGARRSRGGDGGAATGATTRVDGDGGSGGADGGGGD